MFTSLNCSPLLWVDGTVTRPVLVVSLLVGVLFGAPAQAAENLGPSECAECHEEQVAVWEGTRHYASAQDDAVDEKEEASAILEALGEDDMRESTVCISCHFTVVDDVAEDGPSCESCHGAASDWLDIHNNEDVAREEREPAAREAGMLWPSQKFDVAANCMSCHGLSRPGVETDAIKAMLKAGHPLNPEFGIVPYSQGSVRHRYYGGEENTQMTTVELANLYVQGMAAQLVMAIQALGRDVSDDYKRIQIQRLDAAKAVLSKVGGDALIANPSVGAARAFIDSLADQDLSSQVGDMLPDPADYK